jgi:hypothetical protein
LVRGGTQRLRRISLANGNVKRQNAALELLADKQRSPRSASRLQAPVGSSAQSSTFNFRNIASSTNQLLLNAGVGTNVVIAQGSKNGAAGQMPAFFDGELFTVNMKEMPHSDPLIEHQSINEIYASNDLDEEQDFVPVIDAIQGEGFNPLWRQF